MAKSKSNPEAAESEIRVETLEQTSVLHTLEIEVDASRVGKEFDRAFRELGRQVRVKGFRPGKAPRSVLEPLYGASIAEQLEQTLVSETLADAIELAGVEPVSQPSIESGKPLLGANYKYIARIEVSPEIELPDLTGLPVVRPEVHVDAAQIDERLEQLRESNAPLIEEPDGTELAEGHTATIDFVGRIDGELFEGGSQQGATVQIGAGGFIEGFEEQLIGAEAGEDRELSVTFPEAYGNTDLAGKQAVFAVHVVDIRRRQVPELDDEFAKDLGEFDSLDALRERLRGDLETAAEREAKATFRESLLDAVLERTDFVVPPGMIERQLQGQLSEAHRRLQGQVDHDAIHGQLDRWREEWRPRAERDVRELLVVEAVAKAQSIEVEDDEVYARIDELLGDSETDAARRNQLHEDEQLVASLRGQLREEKVLEFLGSQAKVGESTGT